MTLTPSATPLGDSSTGNPGFVLGSKIIGCHVKNQQNEDLGTISNLLVNPETGHIRYAVVSTGGKKVTVPWSALRAENSAGATAPHLVLNTTREKLAKAPTFQPNKLSELYNRTMEEPIFTYYDIVWFPDVLTSKEQSARSTATAGTTPRATPTPYSTATPSSDMTATPTPYSTATPASDMTATPAPYSTATPSSDMTITPTPYATATPASDMMTTPTSEATATPH
jgi:hypothetical protein